MTTPAIGDPQNIGTAVMAILDLLPAVAVGATETYKVKTADPPPVKLDSAELPLAYLTPGPAADEGRSTGDDEVRETRQYALRVPVISSGQGTPGERETRCRPILAAVKAWLRMYPHLGTAGVEAQVNGDSGVVVLPDFEGKFIGFEVRLQVTTLIVWNYAANE
jgi:hypothetical protein